MKIYSDPLKDTKTDKPKPGSYEWWYFDAIDPTSGLAVVVIFFDGNPFSGRYIEKLEDFEAGKGRAPLASNHPAISISVYLDGKPLFYSFEEVMSEEASFSEHSAFGKVGLNRFWSEVRGDRRVYELVLDQTLESGERFTGQLSFQSPAGVGGAVSFGDDLSGGRPAKGGADSGEGEVAPGELDGVEGEVAPEINTEFSPGKKTSLHEWNLVMPRAEVVGSFAMQEHSGRHSWTYDFHGTGYHDHNMGDEPMKESFKEWYWGRFHKGDETFLFYLMHEEGQWSHRAWWIDPHGRAEPFDGQIVLKDLQQNIFGLPSARKIEAEGDPSSFFIQLDKVVDNGPYYQRFFGRLIMSDADMSDADQSLWSADGICEYIRPARIYSRIFWPLVKMRIRYPGRPHWVQKSSRLYRWTW